MDVNSLGNDGVLNMASKNEEDIQLLYSNPRALLEKYQDTIGFIVGKFVASGFFLPAEKADIIQTVNEKLWREKIRNMQAQYNYSVYVVTYFSKIVYNLCLELRRSQNRERATIDRTQDVGDLEIGFEDNSGLRNAVIAEEIKRFATILKLFGKWRAKLELCLQLLFRLELREDEIRRYCPQCRTEDTNVLLAQFGGDYEALSDKEIYTQVTPIFNRCEAKDNSPDALRKWINLKVEEIIALLNGRTRRSNYDRETLKILAQKYFDNGKRI